MTTILNEAPPAAPTAANTHPDAAIAASLYGSKPTRTEQLPEAVVELRKADTARAMYDDATGYGRIDKIDRAPVVTTDPETNAIGAFVFALHPTATDAELKAEGKAWASVAKDLHLDRGDVDTLRTAADSYARRPPSAEDLAGHQRTALAELRRAEGPNFEQTQRDTRALVTRDPRVALKLANLIHNPAVLTMLAGKAKVARARGQLK